MITPNKHGFTLIEVLMVLGIIALLTAILLPVFFKARQQSHKATCVSNLHQVHLALRQYVDENDAAWPINEVWNHKTFTKIDLAGCPDAVPPSHPVGPSGVSGYAYNTAFTTTEGRNYVGISDHAIPYPSFTVVVCEEAIGQGISYAPDPNLQSGVAPPEGEEKGWLRHNGGANYLLADGHIKWYLPDAVGSNTLNTNTGNKPTFALDPPL